MKYRDLPPQLRRFIAAQTLVAAAAIYYVREPLPAASLGLLAFLMFCGALGGACKVEVNVRTGWLTLGFTVAYFALLLLGTTGAILAGLSSTVASAIVDLKAERRRVVLRRLLSPHLVFNAGNCVLATVAMGWVFRALGGRFGAVDVHTMAVPILASALVYYVVNTSAVALVIGWSQGKSPIEVFRHHYAWAWSGYLGGAAVSAFLVWSSQTASTVSSGLLLLPPCYGVYCLFRLRSERMRADIEHMRELNRLNDAIISSLVMAIDAKDRHTRKHVNRVREYAVRVAEALKVPAEELQAIRIAALLHDVGKIGIPEQILCKPGKLTAEEFRLIQSHVEIGAAILEQVRFPWPVVPIVRTHHERWDGLGYPRGLKGEEIPIGGRILALVDVYDALTSDRPYRRAVSREQAIEILRAGSGSQFDPLVVETFVRLLPEMDSIIGQIEASGAAAAPRPDAAPLLGVLNERPLHAPSPAPDAEEEARLREALARAVSRMAPLPDLAPRLAAALREAIPFSTCALFVADPARGAVAVVHASGLWTHLLDGLEIRLGEGVSGRVAATGRPEANALASADLARRVRPGENLELNTALSAPLWLDGRPAGALTLYHSGYQIYQPLYQPHHLARLEAAARILMEHAETAAWRQGRPPIPKEDPVTGLPNARSLEERLRAEIHRAGAQETVFSLGLLRLPELAELPETEREIGLAAVARALRGRLRPGELLARAVGPTLAALLPRRSAPDVEARLAELAAAARTAAEQALHRPLRTETARADYPTDGPAPELLLAAAERRLDPARPDGSLPANGPGPEGAPPPIRGEVAAHS